MRVTIDRAADALRNKAREVARRAREAETENGREALRVARLLSSGPLTSRQLVMLGHPYAARAPRAGRPAVINVQTGRFRAGWRLVRQGNRTRIVNHSPLSRIFARGTRLMIRRPIAQAVAQTIRRGRERRLVGAVQQGLEV